VIISHDLGHGNKAPWWTPTDRWWHATEGYPVGLRLRRPTEQDAEHWWDAVCHGHRRLLEKVPGAAGRVAGVSFLRADDGRGADGRRRRPGPTAIIWADTRSTAQTERCWSGGHGRRLGSPDRLNPTYSRDQGDVGAGHRAEVFAGPATCCWPRTSWCTG